jgi:cystathionine beta-lyase
LQSRPEVEVVNHPALPSHPQHALWMRDFKGASGVFSFSLRSVTQTQLAAFIDHLQYFGLGYSWGGFESLVMASYPTRTVKPWQGGQLVRLSIGLEDVEDLIADLEAGFVRLNGR